ncbi:MULTISPECIES: serine hydrolase [unclassified Massilia]|uniref:serine hydrolase domain-containing protein n=1 Tax=unclassified Massilia TaxID=2609279 RepID=UPI000B25AEAE|nr:MULTISPECIES: serine hydrolase domain-containing protein [unclassified Massilia]
MPAFPSRFLLATACAAVVLSGCATPPRSPMAEGDQPAGLDAARFAEIDDAVLQAVDAHQLPGAVLHLERGGQSRERAYGKLSYEPDAAQVATTTLFDAASLSKVLATAPSVLKLAEEGRIDLDAKLVSYFPECANGGKDAITIRHLLTHSSGLPAGLPAKPAWHGDAAAHALACRQVVTHAPGTFFRYSDINYILLGQLVQKVSGMPLDEFARTRIFEPLKMRDTGYAPLRRLGSGAAASIAPTQKGGAEGSAHGDLAPGQLLQGVVHDPTARRMDGVAGSAGVFTTARDVARYARMLLQGGELDGVRILSPDSVRLMTTPQSPAGIAALRGLGMDIASPYAVRPRGALFPVGSYGHTGFTGCVLWIDPGSRTFYVLLSNRVYPDDKSNVLALYTRLGTLAAQAGGVSAAPGSPALTAMH